MELEIKVWRSGNGLVINIPTQIVKALNLKENDGVLIDLKKGIIQVRKKEAQN